MKTIVMLTIAFAIWTKETVRMEDTPKTKKYCREVSRWKDPDDIEDYLLVDAELNATIILECKYCKSKTNYSQPKFWHWQDIAQTEEEKEVELGMDKNISLNHLHMTAEFSLIIRGLMIDDAGIYRCHGENDTEQENKYNYRLEPVIEVEGVNTSVNSSNPKDWKKYNTTYLGPVSLEFSTAINNEYVAIREEGIILEVVSEWSSWSPCENCKKGKGNKTRRAQCRLKSRLDGRIEVDSESEIVQFFTASPLIPCRSRVLQERFPSVSNATRHLPEFVLAKKCKPCKKKKKRRKYKYKRRVILQQGGHTAIACPKATEDSNVVWRKDSILLEKGKGRSFRKKDPEPRVFVDMFFTIYVKDVSAAEQGKYTCEVDDEKMMQVKIVVIPKPGVLMQAFVKHIGYLSCIFIFSLIAYCTIIVRACKNRQQFKIQTYEQIMEDKQLLTGS